MSNLYPSPTAPTPAGRSTAPSGAQIRSSRPVTHLRQLPPRCVTKFPIFSVTIRNQTTSKTHKKSGALLNMRHKPPSRRAERSCLVATPCHTYPPPHAPTPAGRSTGPSGAQIRPNRPVTHLRQRPARCVTEFAIFSVTIRNQKTSKTHKKLGALLNMRHKPRRPHRADPSGHGSWRPPAPPQRTNPLTREPSGANFLA